MKNRGIAAAALIFPFLGVPDSQPVSAAPLEAAIVEPSAALRVGGLLEASTVWTRYNARFVTPEGRVVDTGNGGISHSEGQGYGLLLAVAAADRASFDRILSWTDQNLFVREDHLAAWRWLPTRQPASRDNNATDGDILIAWALAEAADFWREPAYLARAKLIAADVVKELLQTEKPYGLVLSPAVAGFSAGDRPDGRVINLSYWIFPAFSRLEQLAPEAVWSSLQATGRSLIESGRAGRGDLPSDWLAIGADSVKPAEGFPTQFGYNAIRIPLYAFWGGAATPRLMRALTDATSVGANGSAARAIAPGLFTEPGYGNVWSLARCAATGDAYPAEFYTFTTEQNYYPATLSALSLLAAAYRGGPCLDQEAMAKVLGGRQPTAASDLTRMDTSGVVLPKLVRSMRADVAHSTGGAAPVEPHEQIRDPGVASSEEPGVKSASLGGVFAAVLGLALGGGALALYWRRWRTRRLRLQSLVMPDPIRAPGELEMVSPRNLPINPYFKTSSLDVLANQIERAASVSVELGRTLGVIFFRLGGPNGRNSDTSGADGDLTELMAQFRGALRKTDHVVAVNEGEIIACISLLPGLTELKSISERLRAIGRNSGKFDATFLAPAGLAVYPMCGYSAEELIEYARVNYCSRTLATEHDAPTLAPPLPPPRKPRTPRRSRKKAASAQSD